MGPKGLVPPFIGGDCIVRYRGGSDASGPAAARDPIESDMVVGMIVHMHSVLGVWA